MQTEHIVVTGMSCGGCAGNVTRALKAMVGVGDVDVSLATGEAKVQYDERVVTPGQLQSAVKHAGYGVASTPLAQARQSKGCCCGSKTNSEIAERAVTPNQGAQPPRMPARSAPPKRA